MCLVLVVTIFALTLSNAALAYVGPGAGLSLLGALWGLVAAVGAALAFIIFWPLRKLRRRMQVKRAAAETQPRQATPQAAEEQDSEELRRRAQ